MTDEPQKTVPLRANGPIPDGRSDWETRLQKYAHELTVLKVVTYVGDATITPDADGLMESLTFVPGGKPLVTVCNLIGGDITNVIPDSLKDNQAMLDFHTSQVQKAAAILPNNIKVLGEFVKNLLH